MSNNPDSETTTGSKRSYRVGDTLDGRYRLDALIGEGGIAQVFKALNVSAGRDVAIKLLKPELAAVDELVERFLREGRLANRVRHPNVVEVFDVAATADGVPFMVQELLSGETLADYLQRKNQTLTPTQMVRRLVPVVDALAYAHSCGVIHRDIKPENIFFHKADDLVIPKILDFGISKIIDENIRMTATGVVIGTPAYMAPESIMYDPKADARVDQWSIGIVMYEAMLGRLPFKSTTISALFVEICGKEIEPIRNLLPGISEELAAVIHRCLQKDPDARFPSMTHLSAALCDAVGIPRTGKRRRELYGSTEDASHLLAPRTADTTPEQLAFQATQTPVSTTARTSSQGSTADPALTATSVAPGVGAATQTGSHSETSGRSNRSMLAVATLGVGIIGIGLWIALSKSATDSNNRVHLEVLQANDASAHARPTPAASVRFEIVSRHRGAEVLMRGRTYPAPMALTSAPGTEEELITVRAPGFVSRVLSLVLDESMALTIDLEPVSNANLADSSVALANLPVETHADPISRLPYGYRPQRNNRVLASARDTGVATTAAIQQPTVNPVANTVAVQTSVPLTPATQTQPPAAVTQATATAVAVPAVATGLSRQQIRQVATAHQAALQDCADRARSEDPSLRGRLVFRIAIAPSGTPANVVQVGGPSNNAALSHCLTEAISRWRFPQSGLTSNQDFLFPVDLD